MINILIILIAIFHHVICGSYFQQVTSRILIIYSCSSMSSLLRGYKCQCPPAYLPTSPTPPSSFECTCRCVLVHDRPREPEELPSRTAPGLSVRLLPRCPDHPLPRQPLPGLCTQPLDSHQSPGPPNYRAAPGLFTSPSASH